jgi:hypothetical protein
MNKQDCIPGMRVGQYVNYFPSYKGQIVGDFRANTIVVEWDGGHLSRDDISKLLPEAEAFERDATLKDEADRLEQAFAIVQGKIAEDLLAAAKLIEKAQAAATETNTNLRDLYEETQPLLRAMGKAGWRTSSMRC